VGGGAQVRSRRVTIVSWACRDRDGQRIGDRRAAWCWRRGGEKGVGAWAEAGGDRRPRFFQELRRCIRDGQRIGDGLGAGVEAASNIGSAGQVRRRDFFLGGGLGLVVGCGD
jgi:hypothetical protein